VHEVTKLILDNHEERVQAVCIGCIRDVICNPGACFGQNQFKERPTYLVGLVSVVDGERTGKE
jgi:hypothetical protein